MTDRYDAIVIGSGQGGNPLAKACAAAGKKTALIEKKHVGGTCVNVGCTPTKTMVASARVSHMVGRSGDYGVRRGDFSVDLKTVRQRKRDIVESFRSSSEDGLRATENLDLIYGEGRFLDSRRVEIHGRGNPRTISGEWIFINVGCRAAVPEVEGLADVPFLDSTTIMELGEAPQHLLVLGGGYIGLEFGQMFRRFGSEVTIVQRGPRLLAREDPDVAEEVAAILREDGVRVLLDAEARTVAPQPDGTLRLTVESDGVSRRLSGSHLLVAAGRTPNTDGLGLEKAGVSVDQRGFIRVNDRLETGVDGIYALGDVKGGPQFTHISYDDFRILNANLLGNGSAGVKDRLVPYTVFIDPQLGRVGLSETEARRTGRPVKVARMPMAHVARAIEMDETRGFIKAVVDEETDQIVGCAVLGVEGGEIMSLLQMAMMGNVPSSRIRDAVFAHPTLAEALNNLF